MYALASKGFGKKAVGAYPHRTSVGRASHQLTLISRFIDLNKKDFYDPSTGGQKYTAKGKTSTGVEWEANTHQGAADSKTVKVTIPVDSKCKLACEIKGATSTELTASIDLGSGKSKHL